MEMMSGADKPSAPLIISIPSQLGIIRIYSIPLGAQEHIVDIFHLVLFYLLRSDKQSVVSFNVKDTAMEGTYY